LRLWTLHPSYLDAKGLVALWREALLAQKVLQGHTKGYKKHPELNRFFAHEHPTQAIAAYLLGVYQESNRRGYRFDFTKIGPVQSRVPITVTLSQTLFERDHLLNKLKARSPLMYEAFRSVRLPLLHDFFRMVDDSDFD
jgi:hypothetical protein